MNDSFVQMGVCWRIQKYFWGRKSVILESKNKADYHNVSANEALITHKVRRQTEIFQYSLLCG